MPTKAFGYSAYCRLVSALSTTQPRYQSIPEGIIAPTLAGPSTNDARIDRGIQADQGHDVTIVISHLGSGGAQRVATILANTWADSGLRVCVVTFSPANRDFFRLHTSVTRLIAETPTTSGSLVQRVANNVRRIIGLRRALRTAAAPNIIALVTVTNIQTLLAAWGGKKRLIICERNDPSLQSHGVVWDVLRVLLYRFANVVTANSSGALDNLARYVPRAKLALTPNPIEPPSAPVPTGGRCEGMILSVGRLIHQKAHDVLLESFTQLTTDYPDWRVVVLGEGELRSTLEKRARLLGVNDRVDFVGTTEDPASYYRRASIFVLPSRYEGTPNALLEAMSHGLPSIVSDASPGPLEIVGHETNGLVVRCEDVQGLAQAIQRLIQNPDLRERLGEEGRQSILTGPHRHAMSVWNGLIEVATHTLPRE